MERGDRLAMLRARIRHRLASEQDPQSNSSVTQVAPQDPVVQLAPEDLIIPVSSKTRGPDLDAENEALLRRLASVLILVGSVLGMASGAMLVQGGPGDLLTSDLFESAGEVTFTGQLVAAEDGHGVGNASVEIRFSENGGVVHSATTTADGWFFFEGLPTGEPILMTVEAEGFMTVRRWTQPSGGDIAIFTMTEGDGVVSESDVTEVGGWDLEHAVTLSSIVAAVTVASAGIGVIASIEARRGRRYRRTQVLAAIGMLSRGLFVFGPLLILTGMVLLAVARGSFDDAELAAPEW